MKTYETTIILNSALEEAALEVEIAKVDKMIADQQANVVKCERWGNRRMAYEIRKKTHGFYIHYVYESKPELPLLIQESLKINENCLRYMTVVAGS